MPARTHVAPVVVARCAEPRAAVNYAEAAAFAAEEQQCAAAQCVAAEIPVARKPDAALDLLVAGHRLPGRRRRTTPVYFRDRC